MRLYWQRANNPDCLLLSQNQTRKFHAPLSKTPNFQQVFHTYWKKPTKEGSIAGEKRLKKQLLRWKRERERWSEIQLGKADYHGWRGCRYVWVDDSGSVTRHHSISSPVRRVEASPSPVSRVKGARVVSAWPSKEWPILVDTSPISLENYADERPNSLIRSPRNTLIEPRLSNGRIEWFGHESHSVSYTGESRNAFLEEIFQNIVSQDRFLFNLAKLNI